MTVFVVGDRRELSKHPLRRLTATPALLHADAQAPSPEDGILSFSAQPMRARYLTCSERASTKTSLASSSRRPERRKSRRSSFYATACLRFHASRRLLHSFRARVTGCSILATAEHGRAAANFSFDLRMKIFSRW